MYSTGELVEKPSGDYRYTILLQHKYNNFLDYSIANRKRHTIKYNILCKHFDPRSALAHIDRNYNMYII